MKQRNHLLEVRRATVVDNHHTAKIQTIIASDRAYLSLVTQHSNTCDALTDRFGSGNDRARILALRQHDVLWSRRGTLANSFENVHGPQIRLIMADLRRSV